VLQTSQRIGSEPDVARTISLSELGFIAEQRADPAVNLCTALGGMSNARENLQKRALARPVPADNPDYITMPDLEG